MIFLGRLQEYKVFFYRIFLVFFFYQIARVLFYFYNSNLIDVNSISEFFNICFRGTKFDTTAIIYTNSFFILLSVLPLFINTSKTYQKTLFYVYFIVNLLAYALNFVDFIYYRFTQTRTTTAALESVENETNKLGLFWTFLIDYWHVFVLFALISILWVKLYKLVKLEFKTINHKSAYFFSSIIVLALIAVLCVGGIRGDFKHSTRPITLVDASRHVKKISQADMVLNTPFALIRTLNKNYFKKQNSIPEQVVNNVLQPVKTFNRAVETPPNVVVLIVESLSREYIGSFNKHMGIEHHLSFTPFIDSLAQKSLIFPNAFANGRKSIHAMSSILAGIPSFKVAYTSSPYSNQDTQSVVSVLNEMNYDTSFFHGAPNGSMGFLGFGNILGFDHYYGKTEYNNDDDYDGLWGIWDKPFLKYVNTELDKKKEPFMATVFTLTSHSPYVIPESAKGKFPEGHLPIHKCLGYTDDALRHFFNEAKKAPWFDNTIFVLTGDHGNQIMFPTYTKLVNRFAVPILIYKPNNGLVKENYSLAQQIDIYPTLIDMVGYKKPVRTWGRSLLNDTIIKPFALTHNGSTFQLQQGKYILAYDGTSSLGIFDIKDKNLEKPLPVSTQVKDSLELKTKSFIQDYMNRIIDKKLKVN